MCMTLYFYLCENNLQLQWGGNLVDGRGSGRIISVPSPMGFPPVFFRASSTAGLNLRTFLLSKGYTEGFEWGYSDKESSDADNRNKAIQLATLVVIIGLSVSCSYCLLRHFFSWRESKQSRSLLSGDVSYASVSLIDDSN